MNTRRPFPKEPTYIACRNDLWKQGSQTKTCIDSCGELDLGFSIISSFPYIPGSLRAHQNNSNYNETRSLRPLCFVVSLRYTAKSSIIQEYSCGSEFVDSVICTCGQPKCLESRERYVYMD